MSAVVPASPVHPLSGFVTVVLDLVWTAPEVLAVASAVVAGPAANLLVSAALFAICFPAVFLIEWTMGQGGFGPAVAKGVALGIAAAVPLPILGTVAGTLLMGWTGAHHLFPGTRPPGRS